MARLGRAQPFKPFFVRTIFSATNYVNRTFIIHNLGSYTKKSFLQSFFGFFTQRAFFKVLIRSENENILPRTIISLLSVNKPVGGSEPVNKPVGFTNPFDKPIAV